MTDASLPDGIGLAIVDRTVASGAWLSQFPRPLEAAFEAEIGLKRSQRLGRGAFIGIAMFDAFLLADWWVTPDIFTTALWVRLALVTPIALAIGLAFYLNPPPFLRETYAVVGTLLGAASQAYLMVISRSPHQDSQHQAIILIILYLTMVQRVRFWFSLVACLGCFAIHAAALDLLPAYPFELKLSANAVFGCAVIFALIAAYRLERERRLTWLLELRGRLQNHELKMISRRDPLTGLGNRRSLDDALARCEESEREQLALLLFDIDHFKLFNDSFGHQAGDVCLKRIAGIAQAELRERGDAAFRFGGEEFLVVLRETDLPAAVAIAERMRRAIEEAAIPHPALSPRAVVTASFGVASAMLGEAMRPAEIVAGADAALYAAKRNGRNQVWPRLPSLRPAGIIAMPGPKSRAS